jgi:hypothetical protein
MFNFQFLISILPNSLKFVNNDSLTFFGGKLVLLPNSLKFVNNDSLTFFGGKLVLQPINSLL